MLATYLFACRAKRPLRIYVGKHFKATLESLNPKTMRFWFILKYVDFCYAHSRVWNCPRAPGGRDIAVHFFGFQPLWAFDGVFVASSAYQQRLCMFRAHTEICLTTVGGRKEFIYFKTSQTIWCCMNFKSLRLISHNRVDEVRKGGFRAGSLEKSKHFIKFGKLKSVCCLCVWMLLITCQVFLLLLTDLSLIVPSCPSAPPSGVKEALRWGRGLQEASVPVCRQTAEQRAGLHKRLEPHLWRFQER